MEDEPITEFQSFSPYYFKIALFIQLLNPVSVWAMVLKNSAVISISRAGCV